MRDTFLVTIVMKDRKSVPNLRRQVFSDRDMTPRLSGWLESYIATAVEAGKRVRVRAKKERRNAQKESQ